MDDRADRLMTTVVVAEEDWRGESLELSAESFHHLFRVRRLRRGDRLRVVDGEGRARVARVEEIARQTARLELGDRVAANEPAMRVELLVAAPRPQRAAWLVEKATEIGVFAVRFINTSRGPRCYGAATVERLERVARAAVEQAGRARVPGVTAGHPWEEVPRLAEGLDACWVLDRRTAAGSLRIPAGNRSVGLLIGPEGGWEEEELAFLTELGCLKLGLGERVLRIETAAVVAAAALLVTPSVDTL